MWHLTFFSLFRPFRPYRGGKVNSPVQITRLAKSDFQRMTLDLIAERKTRTLEPQLDLLKLSKHVGERLSIDDGDPVPECVTCGLCCSFPVVAPVFPGEVERIGTVVSVTLDSSDGEIVVDAALPRNVATGSCAFLGGELGRAVGCTIYETRPNACRDFDAGSPRCREYRRMYGLEPRLTGKQVKLAAAEIARHWRPGLIDEVAIVEEGRTHRVEFTDDGPVATEAVMLKIVGFIDDEPHDLHSYYWPDETWHESEFLGKSVEEAGEMIRTGRAETRPSGSVPAKR
jgi:Fe-S-cluster containining protein